MRYRNLLIEDADAARIITLNRPERRNALSSDTIAELQNALSGVQRTVILAAAGPAFCSGHDLRELQGYSPEQAAALFHACSEFMISLRNLPVAVIAEVQGLATAAGCQLVAACDLAVAADGAHFATPGVRIGLFCTTPSVPLVRCVGPRRAMEMLLTGNPIPAQTAYEWGLVNRVVPPHELRAESLRLATMIAEGSPEAIACGKQSVYAGVPLPEPEAYERASVVMVQNLAQQEAHEGISAFLEKRKPLWAARTNSTEPTT